MSKISNELRMLLLLSSGKKYSISRLAEILEVSERMVRSYKEDLEIAGIPISSQRGPYGGYVLDRSIAMPVINISSDDIETLENAGDTRLAVIAEKLKLLANEGKSKRNFSGNEKLNAIQRAIKSKSNIKIFYHSTDDTRKWRTIRPIELFLFTSGWYLVAFCELRKEMRTFEVSEIERYEIIEKNK